MYDPGPITIDASGNVWAVGNMTFTSNSSRIDRFTSSGAFSYDWTEGGSVTPNWGSMTTGPGNTLWLTDSSSNLVDKLTLSPTTDNVTASSAYTIPTASSYPWDITAGPDGNMWFTEAGAKQVGVVTPTGAITEYTTSSYNGGITVGSDGALWFTTGIGVGRITNAGSMTEYSSADTSDASSITTGSDGALWFTEPDNEVVGRLGY
jgi:virginiamycin B lyase